MTRALLGCAIMLMLISPSFANDSVFASQFESLVKSATEATNRSTPSYLNSHAGKWAKRRFEVSEVSYDVKRTSSVLNPIVAVVSFKLVIEQTKFEDTQESADGSVNWTGTKSEYPIDMVYHLQDGKWKLKDGTYFAKSLRQKLPFDAAALRKQPNAVPFVALLNWIE